MKIQSYSDLEKIADNMVVDLSEVEPKLATRAIDFLTGLTCKNGSLTKIARAKFFVKLSELKIIMEKDRKTENKFFLDGDKGVLLDFSQKEDVRLFAAHFLCENVTSLQKKDNAYYIDDYKYLDKDEMLNYIEEISNEMKDGVIKGQTYLCADYCGKYLDIVQTYKKILDEIQLKNYKIVGIPMEQYIDGSKDQGDGDFVVKVMIPVRID